MGRRAEQRLYTAGRFWLALRAESPFYQIRWYDQATKATRGKSTGSASLLDAKRAIHAHAEADLLDQPQPAETAAAVPLFLRYYDEHGRTRRNAATVDSSLRIFTAFLDQDRAGIDVTVAALTPDVFMRFQAWRQKPHGWDIEWRGKRFVHQSSGVSGEAIQRNLDDVRAALNHAAGMGRIPIAPKVRSVASGLRSPARATKFTIEQLGAVVAYAAYDIEALRWVLGMIATGCRPDAVLAWDVPAQWKERGPNFDTHPKGWPATKKRNAIVPIIPEFRPWLEAWADYPHEKVRSRKTWWRTMRDALGLDAAYVPKTIRHTIATELRWRGVSMDEIAGLLGHVSERRTTAGYAKYDPSRLPHAKRELSAIWQEVCASAKQWHASHFRVTPAYKQPISIARKLENV
jgi:integrase